MEQQNNGAEAPQHEAATPDFVSFFNNPDLKVIGTLIFDDENHLSQFAFEVGEQTYWGDVLINNTYSSGDPDEGIPDGDYYYDDPEIILDYLYDENGTEWQIDYVLEKIILEKIVEDHERKEREAKDMRINPPANNLFTDLKSQGYPSHVLLSRIETAQNRIGNLPSDIESLHDKAIDLIMQNEYLRAVVEYQKNIIQKRG